MKIIILILLVCFACSCTKRARFIGTHEVVVVEVPTDPCGFPIIKLGDTVTGCRVRCSNTRFNNSTIHKWVVGNHKIGDTIDGTYINMEIVDSVSGGLVIIP